MYVPRVRTRSGSASTIGTNPNIAIKAASLSSPAFAAVKSLSPVKMLFALPMKHSSSVASDMLSRPGFRRTTPIGIVIPATATTPYNSATAHVDPRLADMTERVEPVLHSARGDDLIIALRRGVEIVVALIEPRLCQHIRLFGCQHA